MLDIDIKGKAMTTESTIHAQDDARRLSAVGQYEATRTLDARLFKLPEQMNDETDVYLNSAISNSENFALMIADARILFVRCQPSCYELVCVACDPARCDFLLHAALQYMFTFTDCGRVLTPDSGIRIGEGLLPQPSLDIETWARSNHNLELTGEWFHAKLKASKIANGSDPATHSHDADHERAVGAAVQIALAGNGRKAVDFYNQWASGAGYAHISIISDQPLTIDVVDAVIEVRDGDLSVLLCR